MGTRSKNVILSITLLSFLVPLGMFNFPTVKATTQSNAPCPQSSLDSSCQFNYPDFGSTTGLDLNGNAQQNGALLRLTSTSTSQAGSAWYDLKQNVSEGFRTIFHFQITPGGGGDGFAFVIQNSNTTALGAAGGGLGYQGIDSSLAVEFDTYQNTFFLGNLGDISDHEIAVHTNGAAANSANEQSALPPGPIISPVEFQKDQMVHAVKVVYSLGVFEVFLDDFNKPVLALAVNLESTLGLSDGTAYVGFTGATGGQTENNDIFDWIFYKKTPSSNIVENGDFSNDLLGWTPVSVTTVRGVRGELPMFQALTEMPAPSKCTPPGRRGTSFLAIDTAFGASGYAEQQVTIPSTGAQLTLTSWGWENDNLQLGISGKTNASVRIVSLTGSQLFSDSFTPPPMLNIIDPSNPAAFTCAANVPVSKSYDLSALAGQTVKLRLGSQSNNCCGTLTAFADVDIETPGIAAFHCPPLAGYQATSDSCALPNAAPGKLYSYKLQVTGGMPPYEFSSVSGSLPTGLALESTGNIQGTTTSAGVFRENLVIQDLGSTPPIPVSITITVPPIVTGVSPAAGPVTGGTSLNITGVGFSQVSSVNFNTTTAPGFHIQSDNEIRIDSTPPSCVFSFFCLSYTPGIHNVTVIANNLQSGFWCLQAGCNQFTYLQRDVQTCSSSAPDGLVALPGFIDNNIRFHASRDVSIAVADAELSGSVSISPRAGYCIHTVGGQLKSFNFTTVVDTTASLSTNISLTAQYDNTGKPYILAGPFSQTPLVAWPIIIVPTITPVLYVNANVSGAISGGISLSSEKTFGVTFNATTSKWAVTADSLTCMVDPVSGKMATPSTLCVQPTPVEMKIQGSVKVAIGVQFSFLFFDIAGPVVTPDVFLRLDAGYSSTSTGTGPFCDGLEEGTQAGAWAALCGGAEVRVGMQLNPWLDFLLPTTNWELPPFPIKSVLVASTVSATATSPSATLQPDNTFKLDPGSSTGISVLVAGSYLPNSLGASSSWNLSSFSQTCGSMIQLAPGTFSFTAPNYGETCTVTFTKNFLGLNIWAVDTLSFKIPPVPPAPPANPRATSQPGSLLIQWTSPTSNGGSSVTGYKLYRGTKSGSESLFQTLGVVTSFSDSSVVCQTNYYYEVSALNSAGESSQSLEVNAASTCAPSAPLSLSGTTTTDSVTLTWQIPASSGGSPVTGYIIYRGASSTQEGVLARVGVSTSYTDRSVSSGTTYYYKVAAVNNVGDSVLSDEASATTLSPPQQSGPSGKPSGDMTPQLIFYAILGVIGTVLASTAGVVLIRRKPKR